MASPRVASARVIGNRKARVVLNRAALDQVQLGMADGLQEVGEAIIAEASARAPKLTGALAASGTVAVFALGKLVSGRTDIAAAKNKRGVKVGKNEVVMILGFTDWKAHFAELGTIKERARPFLIPAFNGGIGGAAVAVPNGMRARAGGKA